jgi:hypothetical protein
LGRLLARLGLTALGHFYNSPDSLGFRSPPRIHRLPLRAQVKSTHARKRVGVRCLCRPHPCIEEPSCARRSHASTEWVNYQPGRGAIATRRNHLQRACVGPTRVRHTGRSCGHRPCTANSNGQPRFAAPIIVKRQRRFCQTCVKRWLMTKAIGSHASTPTT